MTDLERAYALVHSDPEHIEAALDAARREGAAEMRERAARLVFYEKSLNGDLDDVADAIRALHLTPEDPTCP